MLCVGEARERTSLNIERIAINLQDARIAGNDGAWPLDTPVAAGAPAAWRIDSATGATATMTLDDIVRGLVIALKTSARLRV